MSEEPRIVLYFNPEYRLPLLGPHYLGVYTLDGVETKVVVEFGNGPRFSILDLTEPREYRTGSGINHSGRLLIGDYRVRRDEIHYTLTPPFQTRLRMSEIIFRRIEDYEPIDPYYWFPEFFPR